MSCELLVIVSCGRAKIWDRDPGAGPTAARDAYTGYPFRVNVSYAERFGAAWVVLSAKHGLIEPGFVIPGPYDVSFNRQRSGPIPASRLREQVMELGLDRWTDVVGLGGRAYREAISSAFAGTDARLHFPFAGLPLGRMVRATRAAVERADSGLPA